MLLEIMVAAIIGISFGNVWTCIFMGFGTSAEHKRVGKFFIAGRFLGLVFLGSAISLLRFAAQDAIPIILLIFGVSTIFFGLFMLLKHTIKTYFSMEGPHGLLKRSPTDNFILSILSFFMVLPGNKKCRNKSKSPDHDDHYDNHEPGKRGHCKKRIDFEGKYGFVLGVLRGATPCAKVIVLAPLLVAVGFPFSLLLILVYALISTVYPIIGYLSADVLSKFERYRYALKILGALILISIGIYTIINVVMWDTIHYGL